MVSTCELRCATANDPFLGIPQAGPEPRSVRSMSGAAERAEEGWRHTVAPAILRAAVEAQASLDPCRTLPDPPIAVCQRAVWTPSPAGWPASVRRGGRCRLRRCPDVDVPMDTSALALAIADHTTIAQSGRPTAGTHQPTEPPCERAKTLALYPPMSIATSRVVTPPKTSNTRTRATTLPCSVYSCLVRSASEPARVRHSDVPTLSGPPR